MKIVCSVRDAAMDEFLQPWYVQTSAMAVRAFGKEVNNPESPMYDTPTDYDLYELGTYDPATGKHTNHEQPTRLARGKDLRNDAPTAQRTQ